MFACDQEFESDVGVSGPHRGGDVEVLVAAERHLHSPCDETGRFEEVE